MTYNNSTKINGTKKSLKFNGIRKLCIPIRNEICGINKGRKINHSMYCIFFFKPSVSSTHSITNKHAKSETIKEITIELNMIFLFSLKNSTRFWISKVLGRKFGKYQSPAKLHRKELIKTSNDKKNKIDTIIKVKFFIKFFLNVNK